MHEGILLVDKGKGSTSFDVVAKVRRALGVKSVGHTGTLDPFATGLLVILVGRYTRLCDYLTAQTKTYQARVCFGKGTATDDTEGEIVAEANADHINEENLREALSTFAGEQQQVPPQYSAISIGGERAYKKARRGEVVEMAPRRICIYNIELVGWSSPFADVEITCSKGTYIRAIARDLGAKLAVPAHLTELRRLASGSYRVSEALPEAMLTDSTRVQAALAKSIDAIRDMQKIEIDTKLATALRQGKRPTVEFPDSDETLLAYCQGEPVALVKINEKKMTSVRGF